MPGWLLNVLGTVGSIVLTLTVTFIFNKMIGLPAALKAQQEAEEAEKEQLKQENKERDIKIAALQAAIDAHRAQSLQIQAKLQSTDQEILNKLGEISSGIVENRNVLDSRLDRLERREKNSLRQKILQEHRIFTDQHMNPMKAWTEMEHHSFFKLVEDYEDLGGNDYVHSDVLPDMNKLRVILMSDRNALYDLMASRKL